MAANAGTSVSGFYTEALEYLREKGFELHKNTSFNSYYVGTYMTQDEFNRFLIRRGVAPKCLVEAVESEDRRLKAYENKEAGRWGSMYMKIKM